jgi:hypothetical protein
MKKKYLYLILEGIGFSIIFVLFFLVIFFIIVNMLDSFGLFIPIMSDISNFLIRNPPVGIGVIIFGIICGLLISIIHFTARCELESSNQILQKNPDDIEALLKKATALMYVSTSPFNDKAKTNDEAKTIFEKVLQIDPNNQKALVELAKISKEMTKGKI